jgi:hypothetical protein
VSPGIFGWALKKKLGLAEIQLEFEEQEDTQQRDTTKDEFSS